MTIVPFPRDSVFGPQDIEAMSTALEDVCTILNLADEAKSEKEFLAKKLVALAHQVPRDAALLRDRMLREIASGRRELACGALWGANKHAAHCSRASPRTFA